MHRLLVVALCMAGTLALGALATAQDASPTAGTNQDPCASPAAGTPTSDPGTPEMAPPAATPDACATPAAAAAETTIKLVDIAFAPAEVTIPANTDVTVHLPNLGSAPHNFSITDKNNPGVPNLGIDIDVAPGQSTAITINAPPGDYYFFCDVPGHEPAGMFGTLHVQ
ncbi:MAG: Copper binding protein plastocyanin/azurin family [Thermomicrobiales bacterium]|jgi:plastocyanin|nr:Copper binding protein plastocyanin/azurin family [Thermomicrobiales bacterium]